MSAASIRSLVKDSVIYGVSGVIGRSMGLLLLPVLTYLLTPTELLHYRNSYALIGLLQLVLMFGMGNSLVRYLIDADDESRVFSSHFWPLITVSTIGSALLFFMAPRLASVYFAETLPGDILLIRLSAAIIWLETVNILPYSLLRAKQRPWTYSGMLMLSVAIYGSLVLFLMGFRHVGMTGVLIANTVGSAVVAILFIPMTLRYLRPVFDSSLFRIYFAFGFPMIFSSLGKTLLDWADRVILDHMKGGEVAGIYTAGYQLGAIANLAVSSFTLAWKPYLVRAAKEPGAERTFARIMTLTVAMLALLFLAVSLLADDLVAFEFFGYHLIESRYWSGLQVIPVVLASYVFYGVYINLTVGCDLAGRTHYYAWTTGIAAAFNISLCFLLIPSMGMMGAAWATLAAYALLAGLLYFLTRKFYPVTYQWGRMALALAVAVALYLGCMRLEVLVGGSWGRIALELAAIALFAVLLLFSGTINIKKILSNT